MSNIYVHMYHVDENQKRNRHLKLIDEHPSSLTYFAWNNYGNKIPFFQVPLVTIIITE